jgi:alkylhydroperoxidase family enzyme
MAFINYRDKSEIDSADLVDDDDNILRIHGVHSRVMRLHYELYLEVMHGPSPLSRVQRELIATMVSAMNQCHY